MNSRHIHNVNEAILVLRHFVNLSAKLLPFLEELERKRKPSKRDLLNKAKIIAVYQSYDFDTETSQILMNSDVLDLIKKTFEGIQSKSHRHRFLLREFLSEHKRLRQNWRYIESN